MRTLYVVPEMEIRLYALNSENDEMWCIVFYNVK